MNAKTLSNIALSVLTFGMCNTKTKEEPKPISEPDPVLNPQNQEYHKKHLGVKKRSTKGPKSK